MVFTLTVLYYKFQISQMSVTCVIKIFCGKIAADFVLIILQDMYMWKKCQYVIFDHIVNISSS